jgi:hypothetical protein
VIFLEFSFMKQTLGCCCFIVIFCPFWIVKSIKLTTFFLSKGWELEYFISLNWYAPDVIKGVVFQPIQCSNFRRSIFCAELCDPPTWRSLLTIQLFLCFVRSHSHIFRCNEKTIYMCPFCCTILSACVPSVFLKVMQIFWKATNRVFWVKIVVKGYIT